MCKTCEQFSGEKVLAEISRNGKLSEVKITNIPEVPYKTDVASYPFVIEYESPDSSFMCVNFQVLEKIVYVDQKSFSVSHPHTNQHIIPR